MYNTVRFCLSSKKRWGGCLSKDNETPSFPVRRRRVHELRRYAVK